ncbi:RcnB family protein [Sphingobium sp.]|uniref:RcnB family protein n=1 Tax=Sphingobium sp. TaxID=1912891 RepID=UPI002C922E08|nr:RcnB family protein [Sphingobium sp.]HUD91274.1 RcnB family protein [Sphingobium sp.]
MFKKIIMALATTTLVASPIVTAQAQAAPYNSGRHEVTRTTVQHKPNGRTVVKKQTVVRKDTGRRWAKGQRFDRRYASNYRVVNNYRDYRLSAPPRGYQWVRSGNDAVLIAITSGIIGAVIGSAIR